MTSERIEEFDLMAIDIIQKHGAELMEIGADVSHLRQAIADALAAERARCRQIASQYDSLAAEAIGSGLDKS